MDQEDPGDRFLVSNLGEEDAVTEDQEREATTEAERERRELRHDLRTPVNAILGLTQLLLDEADGPLTEEQRLQLSLIQDSARTMGELVDRALGGK